MCIQEQSDVVHIQQLDSLQITLLSITYTISINNVPQEYHGQCNAEWHTFYNYSFGVD